MVITVADPGPGMSAEEKERIFEEFEQAGTAVERRRRYGAWPVDFFAYPARIWWQAGR